MAKSKIYNELIEFNQSLIQDKGYMIGDNVISCTGEKTNILFPYREIMAGQIVGYVEKGKLKELHAKTDKGLTINYCTIIKKITQ